MTNYLHGVGGIIMGEGEACIPKVFRLAWPDDVKRIVPQGRHYKFGFGNVSINNVMASDGGSLSKVTTNLCCIFQ